VPTGYPPSNKHVDKAKALVSAAEKSLGPINLQLGVTNTGRNVQLMELVQAPRPTGGDQVDHHRKVQQADYITKRIVPGSTSSYRSGVSSAPRTRQQLHLLDVADGGG